MIQAIKHFYKAHNRHTLFILACFVLFWPLAVFLIWKQEKWSAKARSIITAVFIGFTVLIGVTGYNAPPSIALSNTSMLTGFKTDDDFMDITGDVSTLHIAKLLINGKQVQVSDTGNFSYRLPLNEGDTYINIVAMSEKGTDTKQFRVHRTTTAEFTERKRIADEQTLERKRAAEEQVKKAAEQAKQAKVDAINKMPVCNGEGVSSNCKLQDTVYKTYIYHPPVAEKTHKETVTSHEDKVTGYCTLCNDGSYSPTCATGRGACSWHGGVAQWNAPITSRVPVNTEKTIIDAPAQESYYEKVLDAQFN